MGVRKMKSVRISQALNSHRWRSKMEIRPPIQTDQQIYRDEAVKTDQPTAANETIQDNQPIQADQAPQKEQLVEVDRPVQGQQLDEADQPVEVDLSVQAVQAASVQWSSAPSEHSIEQVPTTSLLSLPHEVLHLILSHLKPFNTLHSDLTLYSLMRSCRYLSALACTVFLADRPRANIHAHTVPSTESELSEWWADSVGEMLRYEAIDLQNIRCMQDRVLEMRRDIEREQSLVKTGRLKSYPKAKQEFWVEFERHWGNQARVWGVKWVERPEDGWVWERWTDVNSAANGLTEAEGTSQGLGFKRWTYVIDDDSDWDRSSTFCVYSEPNA